MNKRYKDKVIFDVSATDLGETIIEFYYNGKKVYNMMTEGAFSFEEIDNVWKQLRRTYEYV